MMGALAASQVLPKSDKSKVIIIIVVIIVIGVILFFFGKTIGGFFKTIGETFGFTRDEDEKKLDKTVEQRNEQAQSNDNPWSPQFYKNAQAKGNAVTLVTRAFAEKMANQIWDSVGVVYDTPTKATSAIKQMPTQAAVSFLADVFNQLHDRDLWNWMYFKFDEDNQKKQLTDMAHFVESLPKYKR